MRAVSLSEAGKNLKSMIDQVAADCAATMIVRRKGQQGAVLISESEWASIAETLHLLSSPRNAEVLLAAVRGLQKGKDEKRELIDP